MTEAPGKIDSSASLTEAMDEMARLRVRHLPVVNGSTGELVGIVSDRDLKHALRYPNPSDSMVEHVMVRELFVVGPEDDLAKVAQTMAERRYGSAIVQAADGSVVGIFTTTDALRVLGELLRERRRAA